MAPHADADVTPQVLVEDGIAHAPSNSNGAAMANGHVANGVSKMANGHTANGTGSSALSNGHAANGHHAAEPQLAPLSAALLTTTLTTSPRAVPAPFSAEERSQQVCTDHMITCVWRADSGWSAPALRPYGALALMPTASCLHYATQCFEGLKLYRGVDGALRLFRPARNVARMRASAARIALPTFDEAELLKLVVRLCAVDGPRWLPRDRRGRFLYVRPAMIASDPALGVQKPREATLFVILCCFPSLDVPRGMKLLASRDDMVRAWPGGFGYAKVGANYGPTLMCQGEARARGFDQILWLFGPDSLITEAGASNFFVVWRSRDDPGRTELVTAPLSDRIILDGVTRRSVLDLAESRLSSSPKKGISQQPQLLPGTDVPPLTVVERQFSIAEVLDAYNEGRLLEAFVAGTAYFICGVAEIEWRDETIKTPVDADGCGPYAALLKGWLKGIMYGKERHEWGYVVEEEEQLM